MARAKIKWNAPNAFEEIRKSPKVRADMLRRARAVADAANAANPSALPGDKGYVAGVDDWPTRAHGYVVTSDLASMSDSARRNGLLRALDAGR